MKHLKKRRGAGLATVLVVTTLLLVCAFTVVGVAYNNLSLTSRSNNVQQAHNLAEAAISRAIEKVITSKNGSVSFVWGQQNSNGANYTIEINYPNAPSGSFGLLSFDPTVTSVNGINIPTSYNNFGNDTAVPYNGVTVPADSVHLVGVGICGGATKIVEACLYLPRFPYAIGGSGPIQSGGGLLVATLPPGGNVSDPTQYKPGSLLSNSGAGASAVDFSSGNNITIYGDLQSHTGATLGNATVKGQERLNAGVQSLPLLNITSYDPAGQPNVQTMGPVGTSTPLTGYNRRSGDMSFGSLNLNNGVLYVDGNLTVTGGINGTGAVVVTGQTNVTGTGSLLSDNMVGLVSGGNLTLQGTATNPQSINGLVYSGASISANYATLFGAVISNDNGANTSAVDITNSQVFENQAPINFTVGGAGSVPPVGNLTYSSGTYGALIPPLIMAGVPPGSAPSVAQGLNPAPTAPSVGFSVNLSNSTRFKDSVSGQYVLPFSSNGSNIANPTGGPPPFLPAGNYTPVANASSPTGYSFQVYSGSVAPVTAADLNITANNVNYSGNDTAAATNITQLWSNSILSAYALQTPSLPTLNVAELGAFNSTLSSIITNQYGPTNMPTMVATNGTCVNALISTFTYMNANSGTTPPPQNFNIDLNNETILPMTQQIRVLYWKDDL